MVNVILATGASVPQDDFYKITATLHELFQEDRFTFVQLASDINDYGSANDLWLDAEAVLRKRKLITAKGEYASYVGEIVKAATLKKEGNSGIDCTWSYSKPAVA